MSVGQNASHGCMRMYPHLVRKLFDLVRVGMPVKVIYETVKVGFSPEDRKMYVQAYPDVYATASPTPCRRSRRGWARAASTSSSTQDILRAALSPPQRHAPTASWVTTSSSR